MNPISYYGKTKTNAEKIALNYSNTVCLRFATAFGASPRMRLDLLVNDFTFRACRDKYLILFEEHFKRNYIHVKDVAKAFLFGIQNFEKMKGEAFNVGLSSANLSKKELSDIIKKHVKDLYVHSSEISQDPDKRDYIVSNDKLESLGWKVDYSISDGIEEIIKAYPILSMGRHKNI